MIDIESATIAEGIIVTRNSGFPVAVIGAFFPNAGGTMVYVGDRQYQISKDPYDLLEELGAEKFARINTSTYGKAHWIRIKAVHDVQTTNFAQQEVCIWLFERSEPIRLNQIPIEEVYRHLLWII